LKKQIIFELISRAKNELALLEASAKSNRDYATDPEFRAESKYDTRGLQASYLASAEAKRVEELKLEIQILEEVDVEASLKFGEISIGALVELLHQNQSRKYFLIPTAGGTMVKVDNEAVLVVSVFSPIGDALLGLKRGDEFDVETPKEIRHYQVLSFV
jgi:transcription elongation GreA/GreB family factor